MVKKFTDEEINTIIDLYNQGVSHQAIAEKLGRQRKVIGNRINKLKAKGILTDRAYVNRKYPERRKKSKTQIEAEKRAEMIIALYNSESITQEEIGEKVGLSRETVGRIIRRLIAQGVINEKDPVKSRAQDQHIRVIKKEYREVPSTLEEGETIRCNKSVSNTCVYGSKYGFDELCRYSLITGHCRSVGSGGCKAKACTKYSKISKNNPRLKAIGEGDGY